MTFKKKDFTGIILAGGKSKRMGTDKGLMDWKGKPMVSYSIEILQPLSKRILISTSDRKYERFNHELVPDITPDLGPMGGLLSCLEFSDTEACICLPCDLPNMNASIIEFLISRFDGSSCVVPLSPLPEPLCAIYPREVIPVIKDLIHKNTLSLLNIYQYFPTKYIYSHEFPPSVDLKSFENINTPFDVSITSEE
jgi:molybdopterin-guanine dinucleotide biosynthesis protein A